MWAVETQGLSKSYGDIHSLIDCDLQIAAGSVFGLLGPNGAGKTTLLRTLLGFLHPTRGSGSIAGFDILAR
ncbi:MAG: ATP-binding cassette domain-containing protein [Pirellulaceae bacterium]